MAKPEVILGVDIGGSGIKGAPVEVRTGRLTAPRQRIDTPQPPTPDAVIDTVGQIARSHSWSGPAGCTFPGVVKGGVVLTAANMHPDWVGFDASGALSARLGAHVPVVNDADAAGLAEARFGAGREQRGVVLLLTLGTGIGSALIHDGVLVPNTELGHLELRGEDAEKRSAYRVKEEADLSWKGYAKRVQEYLDLVERALWPDRIIIGGGASKNADDLLPRLTARAPVVAAALRNEAGIVGAALVAADAVDREVTQR